MPTNFHSDFVCLKIKFKPKICNLQIKLVQMFCYLKIELKHKFINLRIKLVQMCAISVSLMQDILEKSKLEMK